MTAKYEEQRRIAESEAARCRALTAQVSTFSHTEAELRSQLNIYVEKFKQVRSLPPLSDRVRISHTPVVLAPLPLQEIISKKASQVEDTLNNSNELFLTFRKEMEEMSKKTKRLEKENLTLTRKHDQTNRNILEMAEERTRNQEELEKWRRKSNHLEALCRRMQEQGRGQGLVDLDLDGDCEGTESENGDDHSKDRGKDHARQNGEMSGGRDDESNRANHDAAQEDRNSEESAEKPVFGPPPPPALAEARANGNKAMVNGCAV